MMRLRIGMTVAAALVAWVIIGCFARSEPAPPPTATPDIPALVDAALTRMAPANPTATPVPPPPTVAQTPTPTTPPTSTPPPTNTAVPTPPVPPTSTPTPYPTNTPVPTPTPTPHSVNRGATPVAERLPTKECEPPSCVTDSEQGYVDWLRGPVVSAEGVISVTARVYDSLILQGRGNGNYSNLTLAEGGQLYGSILPPSRPGWDWTLKPGSWIASEYRYSDQILSVTAQVDSKAATHPGLKLCLWTGGTREHNELLDCTPVQQP